MSLAHRELVEGTDPAIYIGRRRRFDPGTGQAGAGRTYWCEYFFEQRQHRKSLKTKLRDDALRRAHDLSKRLRQGEDVSPPKALSVDQAIEQYRDQLRAKEVAPGTLRRYEPHARRLKSVCTERNITKISQFGVAEFTAFRLRLQKDGLADRTRVHAATFVKGLFKWLTEVGSLRRNPIANERLPTPQKNPLPCPDPQQVRTLIDAADERLRPVLILLVHTGMRSGEARDLLRTDLSFDDKGGGSITVSRGGSGKHTKGRRVRVIPMHPEVRSALESLPRLGERVFTAKPSLKHPRGDGPIDPDKVLRSLKRLAKRCGFENWREITVHSLRRTFCSMLARNNIGYRHALALMGHSNSDMLEHYFRVFNEDAVAAIQTVTYPALSAPVQPSRAPKEEGTT